MGARAMPPTTAHNRRRVLGAAVATMAAAGAAFTSVSRGERPMSARVPVVTPSRLTDLVRSLVHRRPGDAVELPVEGRLAPFAGATGWLNSDPLTPEGLRGRVVLVDFWTYTCVNW